MSPCISIKLRRRMYMWRFSLAKELLYDYARRRDLNAGFLDQLDNCADDAARRLLLGVSR